MEAICIANKHSEILFFSRFEPSVEKAIFDGFLCQLSLSTCGDPPPFLVIDNMEYIYIFRDELYWCCCLKKQSFLSKCGPLAMVDNLIAFHRICVAMIGTITQHSIAANMGLLQEIVIETMCGGYMQMQSADKLQSQIYSKIIAPKESSVLSITPGLFGLEKSAPTTASQQSLLTTEGSRKEVFVDVVEKIWATVSPGGTLLRADVVGSITLHCFLSHSPTLSLILNTDLSTTSSEGFDPIVQLSEVDFGLNVDTSRLAAKKELRVVAKRGETSILHYTLPSSLAHVLPFTLVASHQQLTPSDVELKLKLSSTTGMGTIAPKVVVNVTAPPSTTTIMSRTNGPRNQTVSFTPSDKLISWVITDFPGSSYAQSFIRLVDAGEGATVDNGLLEFEVSKWVCSGLRVQNLRLQPSITNANKWVRYLTTSDTVVFKFS